jgi:hypothetical protein
VLPSHEVRSLIQHFAAGVILAALAVELLPDIGKEHASKQVVLGAFAAGNLFMYALKLWTERLEGLASGDAKGTAVGLLVARRLHHRRGIRGRRRDRQGIGARAIGGTVVPWTGRRARGVRKMGARLQRPQ